MQTISKGRALRLTVRALFVALLFLAIGVGACYLSSHTAEDDRPVGASVRGTVILDAGHGGADGGAVGVNGVAEKDLNLAVAQEVARLLAEAGYEVILTRTDDRLLLGEGEDVKGHRKENDLKNRLAIAKAHPEAIFVSIHMNTFRAAKYSGLQVYYANNAESRRLAYAVQGAVAEGLQPENRRVPQAAGSSIYLLENATGTAVLIECGFLSNPEECALLSQKDYRARLSFSIFCGMMNYMKSLEGVGQ
jgi:N-acetylmuramoyl-L-alanine amidase